MKTKNVIDRLKNLFLDYYLFTVPAVIALLMGLLFCLPLALGTYPFGEEKELEIQVQRLYVDVSGSKEYSRSHYMVGTDKGVFEVDNSLWLGIFNSDVLYSQLQEGRGYKIKTKGRELVNFLFQEYPGITSITALP